MPSGVNKKLTTAQKMFRSAENNGTSSSFPVSYCTEIPKITVIHETSLCFCTVSESYYWISCARVFGDYRVLGFSVIISLVVLVNSNELCYSITGFWKS